VFQRRYDEHLRHVTSLSETKPIDMASRHTNTWLVTALPHRQLPRNCLREARTWEEIRLLASRSMRRLPAASEATFSNRSGRIVGKLELGTCRRPAPSPACRAAAVDRITWNRAQMNPQPCVPE